jgi:UDP-N-acetylglucosamine 2-epimerase (non-hydrolysing)
MIEAICIILGTRPEIIKMSPVVRACEGSGVEWFVGHTGQERLCDVGHDVLGGLGLPDAKDNPDVGSNTLAGTEPERIFEGVRIMFNSKRNWRNPFGDGELERRLWKY